MISPMRRALRILSVSLITAGVVILLDAGITLAWQEPISAIYGSVRQNQAESQFEDLQRDFLEEPAVVDLPPLKSIEKRAKELAGIFEGKLQNGKPFGRLEIPSIDADYIVIQGTDEGDLQKGPGHYPTTALPGQGRTIGIAGHRTTYGAPFNRIDEIEVGDEIEVEMPYATFTYEVSKTDIVDPSDVEIVDDVGHELLVLTACHPLYSAAQRYAVFAELSDITLFPAGEGDFPPP